MKKAFFMSAAVLLFSQVAFASPEYKYCDLVVFHPGFKRYVAEMRFDGNTHRREGLLRDAGGNKIKFSTTVDALNYVVKQGWQLVSCYSDHGGPVHFILTK